MASMALTRPLALSASECSDHRPGNCRYCGENVLPELAPRTRRKLHIVSACMWLTVLGATSMWLGNSSQPTLEASEPRIERNIAAIESAELQALASN